MSDRYHIAIIGSGPAGLSAAGRAAELDKASGAQSPSYVLLEGFTAHAKTIQRYQKGKHVMDEPGYLNLRSDFEFTAGTREAILGNWQESIESSSLNIEYSCEVTKISGQKGAFDLQLSDGRAMQAEHIVLAIGKDGSPRKLGVPGEEHPAVQYHLDDPDEFKGETIVIVGAGDSALENALGLAPNNRIYVVNRRDEFSRAKDGNLNATLAAISDPDRDFHCFYSTSSKAVEATPDAETPIQLILNTPEGEQAVECHRVIARLGGIPPRAFVESCGVEFPNDRPDAIPELSPKYETNVAGLYIIGSLAGYPLIKQGMNQGYDVIEYIHGNEIEPADAPLLEAKFHVLPFARKPDDVLELFQRRIPFFSRLNSLSFRELMIESDVTTSYPPGELHEEAQRKLDSLTGSANAGKLIAEGEYLYRQGEYANSFFTIVDGEVILEDNDGKRVDAPLSRGQFFGEASLISGRPRQENARAGAGCILVETPRRVMVKLFNSNEDVRDGVDWIFVVRELKRVFAPEATFDELRDISRNTQLQQFKAGDVLFDIDETGNSLHLIRRGSVSLQREANGELITLAELRSGELVGEMALMGDPQRRERAVATVATETVEIAQREFLSLMSLESASLERLQLRTQRRLTETTQMNARPESSALMTFMLGEGLGEATDVLLIDEKLCIGCDNCEIACAETHGGLSRLDRAAGKSFAHIHVPISCRHCEHPHCMKDCMPNAIHRAPGGQVFIDDTCIGCGNCEANCPYDAIKMSYDAPKKPSLMSWLLFGSGSGPGEPVDFTPGEAGVKKGKKAVKCDACVNDPKGPACVRACPTGAAQRVNPEQFIKVMV